MKYFSSTVLALALMAGVSACSSKQGVDSAGQADLVNSADDSAILGDDEAITSVTDETFPGAEALVDNDSSVMSVDSGNATTNPSQGLELGSQATSDWHGSLKSTYQPGMKEWTVSRGESLSLIAKAVYGNAADFVKLQQLNPSITDANMIAVGQVLRLPGSSDEGSGEVAQNDGQAIVAPGTIGDNGDSGNMPMVSNDADTAAAGTAVVDPAQGSMATVENTTAPAPAPTLDTTSGLSSMIKKVDMNGNKMKMRNLLLGVAAFFLVLSGLIFILSRRKKTA